MFPDKNTKNVSTDIVIFPNSLSYALRITWIYLKISWKFTWKSTGNLPEIAHEQLLGGVLQHPTPPGRYGPDGNFEWIL